MEFDDYYSITTYPIIIAHYGTKGMKWGVWNAETRARRSGSSNSVKVKAKQFASSKQGKILIGTAAVAAIAGATVATGVAPAVVSAGAKAIAEIAASEGAKVVANTAKAAVVKKVAKVASKPVVKKVANKLSTKVTKEGMKQALKQAAVTGATNVVVDKGREEIVKALKSRTKGAKSNAAE